MSLPLESLCWPPERLGDALFAIAAEGGLRPAPKEFASSPARRALEDPEALERWFEDAGHSLGLEVSPLELAYPLEPAHFDGLNLTLVPLPRASAPAGATLAIVRGGRRSLWVLGPDLKLRRIATATLQAVLEGPIEAKAQAQVEALLSDAEVRPGRRRRARRAIYAKRLFGQVTARAIGLRLPPGASFWRQLRMTGVAGSAARFSIFHLIDYTTSLVAWFLVGKGALEGRFDQGWFLAWVLLLLTMVPLRMLVVWWQGSFAMGFGTLFKRRLLRGAMSLEPEEISSQGIGQLIGRVYDSETIESTVLGAGVDSMRALLELGVACAVLAIGAGGGLHVLLYLLWIGLTVALSVRAYHWCKRWTLDRLNLTSGLVERMVGHRTRIVQERKSLWHKEEDEALERYQESSRGLDRIDVATSDIISKGWLLVGLLGLVPAFLAGEASAGLLAVGLGGVLLGERALGALSIGFTDFARVVVAWRQASLLYHAAERKEAIASPEMINGTVDGRQERKSAAMLETHDLSFGFPTRATPVIEHCNLNICSGDRLLLEGPSGSGKSTLCSLLAGLRKPKSGLLLHRGLDRQTLGAEAWRHLVAMAPQFQSNHIFTGTLAYNLLLSRRWPPRGQDLAEAEQICGELGLTDLVRRMPGGMQQMVGETGWQMSHGERSRVFMARALLQDANLVILDESFAALDPVSLRTAILCVLKRAKTVLVVAHP